MSRTSNLRTDQSPHFTEWWTFLVEKRQSMSSKVETKALQPHSNLTPTSLHSHKGPPFDLPLSPRLQTAGQRGLSLPTFLLLCDTTDRQTATSLHSTSTYLHTARNRPHLLISRVVNTHTRTRCHHELKPLHIASLVARSRTHLPRQL